MHTVLVGDRGLVRYLLAAVLRADWDVVSIFGTAEHLRPARPIATRLGMFGHYS